MISWAIAHGPYFGVALLAFAAGVIFAAHRQLRVERRLAEYEEWLRVTRSIR